MRLFHNKYRWDEGTMTAVRHMNWYVDGYDHNPNNVAVIVAATEEDALAMAHREDLYIESVTVRNNLDDLMAKKHREYLKFLKSTTPLEIPA